MFLVSVGGPFLIWNFFYIWELVSTSWWKNFVSNIVAGYTVPNKTLILCLSQLEQMQWNTVCLVWVVSRPDIHYTVYKQKQGGDNSNIKSGPIFHCGWTFCQISRQFFSRQHLTLPAGPASLHRRTQSMFLYGQSWFSSKQRHAGSLDAQLRGAE